MTQPAYLPIPVNVATALREYLLTRPMGEVRVFVEFLEKTAPRQDAPPPPGLTPVKESEAG